MTLGSTDYMTAPGFCKTKKQSSTDFQQNIGAEHEIDEIQQVAKFQEEEKELFNSLNSARRAQLKLKWFGS